MTQSQYHTDEQEAALVLLEEASSLLRESEIAYRAAISNRAYSVLQCRDLLISEPDIAKRAGVSRTVIARMAAATRPRRRGVPWPFTKAEWEELNRV